MATYLLNIALEECPGGIEHLVRHIKEEPRISISYSGSVETDAGEMAIIKIGSNKPPVELFNFLSNMADYFGQNCIAVGDLEGNVMYLGGFVHWGRDRFTNPERYQDKGGIL